jgi:DNA-binding GntR family transcriptional regulator
MPRTEIDLRSLREQVYDHLRGRLGVGKLAPGGFLDLNSIAAEIGISRTPLRDALLQLESDGFVEILPRRGVRVRELSLEGVRDIYQLLGALEGAALSEVGARLEVEPLDELLSVMRSTLAEDDFESFYARNLEFHDCWLELSGNDELRRTVRTLKQRLYDFPRNPGFIKEWEQVSCDEHEQLVGLLRRGEIDRAATYLRDVHWSFTVQEPFIRKYHFDDPSPAEE